MCLKLFLWCRYTLNNSHYKVKGQGGGGRASGGSRGGSFPAHSTSHSARAPHIPVAEPRAKMTRADAEDTVTTDDDPDDGYDDGDGDDGRQEEEDEEEDVEEVDQDRRGRPPGSGTTYQRAPPRGYSSGRGRQPPPQQQQRVGRGSSPRGAREVVKKSFSFFNTVHSTLELKKKRPSNISSSVSINTRIT